MSYYRFISYNIVGGILWTTVFIYGGYYFGNLPAVKNNFTQVIAIIIVVSFLPGILGYLKHRRGG